MQVVQLTSHLELIIRKVSPVDSISTLPNTVVDKIYSLFIFCSTKINCILFNSQIGDRVVLLGSVDSEWMRGQCGGHTGLFPSSFVQPDL